MPIPQCILNITLDDVANIFAIATGLVAVAWFGVTVWDQRVKRLKLEKYLRDRRLVKKTYQHSRLHLMAYVGLTEAEILHACLDNPLIKRIPIEDEKGIARDILFEYAGPEVKR